MVDKKVVYICIVGNYDNLLNLSQRTAGFDYICFTDADIKSDFWQIRPLPKETEGLSNVKKQRYVKINTHKVLPEYDFSLYIDGNIDIIGNICDYINDKIDGEKSHIYIPQHVRRDCVYDEAHECIRQRKDSAQKILWQIISYKTEGFPQHMGLTENSIIFRFHNEEDCIRLMEAWWIEYLKQPSCRDQLSLPYVLWKNNDIQITRLEKKLYDSNYFKRLTHLK